MGEKVFSSEIERNKLEELAHPVILSKLISYMDESESTCFCEVPLLLEENLSYLFDKIIVVCRDKEDRLLAVMDRDNFSREIALQKIASQFDYDRAIAGGYFDDEKFILLQNNDSLENLKNQIENSLKNIIV